MRAPRQRQSAGGPSRADRGAAQPLGTQTPEALQAGAATSTAIESGLREGGQAFYASPELARDLLIEEYKAIRAKSVEARNNQQSIIQWSLAAAGVALAGVISGSSRGGSGYLEAVIFALSTVVPLVLLCALAIWLSEVARMLRAARYIRAREEAFARVNGDWPKDEQEWFEKLPLVWETLLVRSRDWKGKADLGPLAVLLLYGTLICLSNAVAWWLLRKIERPPLELLWVGYAGMLFTSACLLGLAIYALKVVRHRAT